VSIYTKANTWLIININSHHIRFSIFNIIHVIVLVFHKHYYDDVAQVKCSLSRSDGDSNRLLTSWCFIRYTNHTHSLSELHVTNDTISIKSWDQQEPPYPGAVRLPEIRPILPLGSLFAPLPSPIQIQYGALSGSIPGPNRVTSFAVGTTYPAS
jgi:hypothetical protein